MSQPQPPFDEQGEAHEALTSAVTSFGPRILHNPQMLNNVVTDLLPDLPREQNLLIAAAEADVATDLTQNIRDRNIDAGTAVQLVAHSLADKKAIDPAASIWVTTEYAKALGYEVPVSVPRSIPPPVPPPSSHSVPPSAAQSVPSWSMPPQSAPPYGQQSVPPYGQQSVPPYGQQSVPPYGQQSVPPYGQQSVPPYGQQSVPPTSGSEGGAPTGGWTHGLNVPGMPPTPPDNGKKNRSIIIAAISAAAVVVIVIVIAVTAHGRPTAAVSPTATHSSSRPTPAKSSPSAVSSSPSPSPQRLADDIANAIAGNSSLHLVAADGTAATEAKCDPRSLSIPADPTTTPLTDTCDIMYSDGTIWRQHVSITFDESGNPVSDSADAGTQIR